MADKQEAYKELSCKDFRSDCDFTIRAKTEEILLERCRKHACSAHDKCAIPPEKVKSHIRDIKI
jgi:predicted small metal-binding protein